MAICPAYRGDLLLPRKSYLNMAKGFNNAIV